MIRLSLILCLVLVVSAENLHADNGLNNTQSQKFDHLFWGHYRPHRLSIVTQRSRSPISVGLLYSSRIPYNADRTILDYVVQDSVGPSKSFIAGEYMGNDGERFSQQMVVDMILNMSYNVSFLKTNLPDSSDHSWVYLIEPYAVNNTQKRPLINTFVHISGETLDGEGRNTFEIIEESETHYLLKAYDLATNTFKGYFDIEIIMEEKPFVPPPTNETEEISLEHICEYKEIWAEFRRLPVTDFPLPTRPFMCFMNVDPLEVWDHKQHIYSHLVNDRYLNTMRFDEVRCRPAQRRFNLGILQIRSTQLDFKVKVTHHSRIVPNKIAIKDIELGVASMMVLFYQRLEKTFPLSNPPAENVGPILSKIRRSGISNLLGGLSYTYGPILIKRPLDNSTSKTANTLNFASPDKKELFSSSPSRITFPRGFLWDEGFHLLLICRWDRRLCMEIIQSWLNTMSPEGWIPREQARGPEQESMFSEKRFLYQSEHEANPPTLLLALEFLMQSTNSSHPKYPEMVEFLNSGVEAKIVKWFQFFNQTQRNFETDNDPQFKKPLFRWHCVEPCERGHIMGSGLDDYPRADEFEEPIANIDLQVWMIVMVKTLNAIKAYKQEAPDPVFVDLEKALIDTLEEFKDPKDKYYKDIVQDLKDSEPGKIKKKFNSHFGYVNLFPFLFGLVPPGSDSLKMIFALTIHPKGLWSEYGVRSLATVDKFFMRGEQYWTEPIWMNINYLIVRAVVRYYPEEQGVDELYKQLRSNLLRTVTLNFMKTYTFWENYSSISGKGQRSPAFYGWTSLVVLLISEMY